MGTIWRPEEIGGQGPKYKAVVEQLRSAIASGDLQKGEKLPPVRELAWQLSITPGTVARAYTVLTDEGVLTAEVGRGTFVSGSDGPKPIYREPLIEEDAAIHNAESQGYNVNLVSPHLPSVGQARLIRELLAEVAQNPPSGMMHYPNRRNLNAACEAAAHWVSQFTPNAVHADQVVLAHGGQNAILTIMQTILRGRRPTVLVEELSYPGFRRAAEIMRADVVPVPMDRDGVIPEALEAAARAHDAQLFCTSPEVHNPTCGFTTRRRREALAAVALRQNLQSIDDDCYRLGAAQAPGYRQLAPEISWHVSSISKSVTPALRLGIAVAPKAQVGQLRRISENAFFGLATPMADLFAKLLVDHRLPPLIEETKREIGRYVQCAVNGLGGYDLAWRSDVSFLYIHLPSGWRAGAFAQAAQEQGIRLRPAEEYACRDSRAPHAVRFAINAGVSLQSFEAAIMRLRDLLDNPPAQIGV